MLMTTQEIRGDAWERLTLQLPTAPRNLQKSYSPAGAPASASSPGHRDPGSGQPVGSYDYGKINFLFYLDSRNLNLLFHFTIQYLCDLRGREKGKKTLGKETQCCLAPLLEHRQPPPPPWLPGARFQVCVDIQQLEPLPGARTTGRSKAPPAVRAHRRYWPPL